MADEATLIFETSIPIPMTVANATGIEKGTFLKLTDPLTAALSASLLDRVAGIAAVEKIASDGVTKLAVFRGGIFKGKASGNITAGDAVGFATSTASNTLRSLQGVANLSGNCVVGVSLETATTGETFLFELKPQTLVTA